MGCQPKYKLPTTESLLQPAANNQKHITKFLKETKEDQKKYHDCHASKDMTELQPGTKVCMQPWKDLKVWKPAIVVKYHHTLRSYVVQAEDGSKYCCNRQHQRVGPAPGHGALNIEILYRTSQTADVPLRADKNEVESKAPLGMLSRTNLQSPLRCQISQHRSNMYSQKQQK